MSALYMFIIYNIHTCLGNGGYNVIGFHILSCKYSVLTYRPTLIAILNLYRRDPGNIHHLMEKL